MKFKGQLTLEFIGTALVFILIIGLIGVSVLEPSSSITKQSNEFQKNLEAKEITTEMLTTPGNTTSGSPNWGPGDNLDTFGLADSNEEFMTINRTKLTALKSINNTGSAPNKLNYSEFVDLTAANNQYQFEFTWFPTIETFENFQKESPPQEPFIREPTGAQYDNANDRVHYGNTSLLGDNYYYLVTAEDGKYQDVYVTDSWDFRGVNPIQQGDEAGIMPENLTIRVIQNQRNKPGAFVMFERHEKTFGAQRERNAATFKFNRYGVYIDDDKENHPMRMEVFVW